MPEPLSRGGEEFLLRVKGESMINAGILDGDIVVVRREQDASNGDIVVALAGDDETTNEATVKRFFSEDGRIRLQPENDALEPIYAEHVQILGKVIGSSGGSSPGNITGFWPESLNRTLLRTAECSSALALARQCHRVSH